MIYNELVEAYFFAPNHVGTLALTQPLTVHYRGGEPGRGDVFDLYLLGDKTGYIKKACFKAYGNPYLLAAAEWLCRHLEASHIEEHPCFDYTLLIEQLAIPKTSYPIALQIEDGYCEVVQKMKMKLIEERQ